MAALQEQVQHGLRNSDIRNTVIITGFGPFGNHPVNASWEAVKLLPSTGIDKELGICLVTEQVSVGYEDVNKKIPVLWDSHKPLLVIHVGVSKHTRNIKLESVAHKSGYVRCDIYGKTPTCYECCFGSASALQSGLNLMEVNDKINTTSSAVQTEISQDAGGYLCEYIYYLSLSIDSSRTLFIHVPPLDTSYSAEQMARGLADIIRCLVDQLRSKADHR